MIVVFLKLEKQNLMIELEFLSSQYLDSLIHANVFEFKSVEYINVSQRDYPQTIPLHQGFVYFSRKMPL